MGGGGRTWHHRDVMSEKPKPQSVSREEVARLAQQIWEDAGRPEGLAEQHWFEAERRLEPVATPEAARTKPNPKPAPPVQPEMMPPESVPVASKKAGSRAGKKKGPA